MAPRKRAASTVKSATLDDLLDPLKPGKAIQERKFQAILDAYNNRAENKEEGLSGVKFYIFRTFPRIDNTLSGRQFSNIESVDCVKHAAGTEGGLLEVTELPEDIRDYITKRHGGGRYRVSLNDKGREHDQVTQTAIKVDEIEHPPVLDPRELVLNDPETMTWITRQVSIGALVKLSDGSYAMSNTSAPRATGAASEPESAGMAAVAIEAMRNARAGDPVAEHASKAAIDMVVDAAEKMRAPAVDPVAQFTAMANVLKPANGDAGATTAMIGLITTMMVESNKMTMFLMQQITANREAAPARREPDEIGRVERLLKMVGDYGGPKPAGGLMDTLKEWAPMLLPGLMMFMGRGNPQAAAAAGQMIAGMANRPGDGAAADPMAAAQPGQFTVQQAEEFAARAAAAMSRNQPGDDFALGVEVIFGPATYDMIRKLGRDNIIAFMLQSQHAQYFAANGPQVTQFIQAFMDYGEEEAPPAPGAPTAAAPPAAPPTGTPPAPPPPGTGTPPEVAGPIRFGV